MGKRDKAPRLSRRGRTYLEAAALALGGDTPEEAAERLANLLEGAVSLAELAGRACEGCPRWPRTADGEPVVPDPPLIARDPSGELVELDAITWSRGSWRLSGPDGSSVSLGDGTSPVPDGLLAGRVGGGKNGR